MLGTIGGEERMGNTEGNLKVSALKAVFCKLIKSLSTQRTENVFSEKMNAARHKVLRVRLKKH